MTDTGSFGTEERPVILDISQLIRRVAWAIGGTAVVTLDAEIGYVIAPGELDMAWSANIVDSNITELRGKSLLGEIGPIVVEPGPPTAKQKAEHNFYCYKPRTVSTSQTFIANYLFIDRGIYEIFTSSGVITSYFNSFGSMDVPFIIDWQNDTTPQAPYKVFRGDNQGNQLQGHITGVVNLNFSPQPSTFFPQLKERVRTHTDTVTTTEKSKKWKTITFLNLTRAANKDKLIKDKGKVELRVVFASVTGKQFVRFKLGVHTWRGVKTFTYNEASPFLLIPDPKKDPIDAKFQLDNRPAEQRFPSQQIDFTIDLKTFKITATRKALT